MVIGRNNTPYVKIGNPSPNNKWHQKFHPNMENQDRRNNFSGFNQRQGQQSVRDFLASRNAPLAKQNNQERPTGRQSMPPISTGCYEIRHSTRKWRQNAFRSMASTKRVGTYKQAHIHMAATGPTNDTRHTHMATAPKRNIWGRPTTPRMESSARAHPNGSNGTRTMVV